MLKKPIILLDITDPPLTPGQPPPALPLPQNDGSIEEWQQWGNRERFGIYIVLWHAHINAPHDKETRLWQGQRSSFSCSQVKRFAISPPSSPLSLCLSLLADFSAKHITFVNYLVYWPLWGFNMKVVSCWQSKCRRGPQVTRPRSLVSLQLIIYLLHAVC